MKRALAIMKRALVVMKRALAVIKRALAAYATVSAPISNIRDSAMDWAASNGRSRSVALLRAAGSRNGVRRHGSGRWGRVEHVRAGVVCAAAAGVAVNSASDLLGACAACDAGHL